MSVATERKIRVNRRLVKLLKIAGYIGVSVVVLQIGLYFGSDWLFREFVKRQVREISSGKYDVDFERFRFSLLERGFYLTGFSLTPADTTIFDNDNIPYYRVNAPEVSIRGLGYKIKDKVLTVGEIRFKEPVVQSKQKSSASEDGQGEEVSPLRQLEIEVQRSFGENLNDIVIHEIYVDNADLLLVNFISQRSISAEETNLYVKNLKLAQAEQAIPFNADGFQFDLKNFEILLADSIHTVSATSVHISSLDKRIQVDKFQIIPDMEKPSDLFYAITLDNLELVDADIDQMFLTADVKVGNLKLVGPRFTLYTERTPTEKASTDQNLYGLIEDVLSSITIDSLNIRSGSFLQRGINNPNRNRIEADDIFFNMQQVYIGPDLSLRGDQFFYANEAELDISSVRLALADGVHWVSGENVFLSSITDKVSMEKISVRPELDEEASTDIPLFEIEVPFLSFNNANLKKVYNENIVDVEELHISSPRVVFKDLQSREGNASATTSLRNLVKDYLRAIYVDNLAVSEGRLVLDNNLRVRKDSLSFGKINMNLENFQLDEQLDANISDKLFFADNLRLDIENYALKLSDNLHLFSAGRILIDTKQELLDIEGFRLEPFSKGDVQTMLNRYNKTTILDINIPRFTAYGVDINKAYFEEQLLIKHIDIPSPDIRWVRYIKSKETDDDDNKVDRADILNLLTTYFNLVSVDSLTLDEGSFAYDNFANETFQSFSENDVSITIKNFRLDEHVGATDSRTLFAEELDINLNNYVFNIANGKYSIIANRIAFNSAREEINTYGVRLRPRHSSDDKLSISASIPNMSIKGVDLEAFLFESTLALDKLSLSDASVKLSINTETDEDDEEDTNQERGRRRSRSLPKTIDVVKIDEIIAENARFEAVYNEEGKESELIKTGINLAFYGFLLDSTKLADGDIAAFFSNMTAEVDDFSLALSDSVHTINFSKIGLDTQKDEIVLENLNIVPRDFSGRKNAPVISATVPHAAIKTKSLRSFQRTGDVDISSLLLTQPVVTIYLDEKQVVKIKEEEDFADKIRQTVLESLNVGTFEIVGGQLSVKQKETHEEINTFRNISVLLQDLNFDFTSSHQIDTKFFLNSDYQFELNNYEIKLPDSLNTLTVDKITLSENHLAVEGLTFAPRYGRYQYSRMIGNQVDVAEIRVEKIEFEDFDVDAFIQDQKVLAGTMRITDPKAFVFRDKRFPIAEDAFRKMPQQLLMELDAHVQVEKVIVENGTVTYEEFPEKGMIPGQITFSRLNAHLTPLRLTKRKEEKEQSNREDMLLDARMFINDLAELNINLVLAFEEPYPVNVKASINEFELALINSILETNAFVSVESGIVRHGEWYFTADENRAIGEMTLRYNDLKVRLLEERTLEIGRGRKGILTFVVNALALRNNNPRKFLNRLVSSPIYHPRDKDRFIFNYMWRATLSGLAGSSGISKPRIPRREEEE